MKKFINADLMNVLGAAVERNTEMYKGDLQHDNLQLTVAAEFLGNYDNRFLWLSRRCGTVCLPERDVYIKDSAARMLWLYYAEHKLEGEKFIAYAIEVTGMENGRVIGNLHGIDYLKHVEDAKKTCFQSAGIDLSFKDGTAVSIPYDSLSREWDKLIGKHGDTVSKKHLSDNEVGLSEVLSNARKQRDRQCRDYSDKGKADEQKPSIRQRLSEAKQEIADKRSQQPSVAGRTEKTERTEVAL